MSIIFRVLLVLVSISTVVYVLKKIRKAQLQIEDSIFWIASSFGILILSIFPVLAVKLSMLIGIESPANFVFLVIIFILLLKVFMMSLKISLLEHKLRTLVQNVAIEDNKKRITKGESDKKK